MRGVHGPHHRDRGLRRLRAVTRATAVGAVALAGAFTALIARPHSSAAKTTVTTRPATTATSAPAPSSTLPPDTFAPSGPGTPPSPPPTPAPQPPPTAPRASVETTPVTSGAS